jgi:hypothetical protein
MVTLCRSALIKSGHLKLIENMVVNTIVKEIIPFLFPRGTADATLSAIRHRFSFTYEPVGIISGLWSCPGEL